MAGDRGSAPFTFHLIQHSHIDIGYTERQEVIADYHRQFIGQAVRMAHSPAQKGREDRHKFRFTCEGFWAVEQFLRAASREEKSLFARAIEEGLVELGASYLHFTELLDEGHLRDTLSPALDYAKSIGRELPWAGAYDVNGFPWSWVDALSGAGIRYFSTCINTHHGGRPFGKRNVPFHWESKRGNRVLCWEGQTYHRGNLYGLVPCSDSAAGPAFPVGDLALAEATILPKVEEFRRDGIPVDFAPLHIGGLYTDNSPPTDLVCDHIAAWNEKHGDRVEIRLSTMAGFFQRLEQHAAEFPVVRGDWPDWWADGVASTPLETQVFRNAQRVKREIERLDPDRAVVPQEDLDAIRQQLWVYAEHTWGYSDSVPSPWDFLCHQIVLRKSAYAVRADELAMTALDKVLRAKGQGGFAAVRGFEYRVMNTQDEPASGLALLPVDFWEASRLEGGFRVEDASGRVLPHQLSKFGRGKNVAVLLDLGPMESIDLVLRFDGNSANGDGRNGVVREGAGSFDNGAFRIDWDAESGVQSLVCLRTGIDLVDTANGALAAPIHQVFPAPAGKTSSQVRAMAGIEKAKPDGRVGRGRLRAARVVEDGLVFLIAQFDYDVPGAGFHQVEWLLPRRGAWMHVSSKMNKENIWDAEGMYLSFPLAAEGAEWHLDRAGGSLVPGRDQLPKSCCDYYMVQSGAALCGGATGVALAMPDTPLAMIGGLRLWDYNASIEPTGPLHSWQTNNKWETNFKATCGGFYEFRYALEVGPAMADAESAIAACRRLSNPFRTVRK